MRTSLVIGARQRTGQNGQRLLAGWACEARRVDVLGPVQRAADRNRLDDQLCRYPWRKSFDHAANSTRILEGETEHQRTGQRGHKALEFGSLDGRGRPACS